MKIDYIYRLKANYMIILSACSIVYVSVCIIKQITPIEFCIKTLSKFKA